MYIILVKSKPRSRRPSQWCHKAHSQYLRLFVYPKRKLFIGGNKEYGSLCSGVLERNLQILLSVLFKKAIKIK
jgi:hypothetical protein